MKTIILIIKAILMYGTLIYWILLITGADSLMEQDILITSFAIGIALIFICKILITKDDFLKITFTTKEEYEEDI